MMKVAKLFLIVSGLIAAGFGAVAQQDPQPAAPNPEEAQSKSSSTPFETFKPREEISEDLPVAFPKDI